MESKCAWPSLPMNRDSCCRRRSDCCGRLARLGEREVGALGQRAEVADRVAEELVDHVPHVVRAEPVVRRARQARHRVLRRGQGGQQRPVEAEALHRVVSVSDHVDEPAEPAGRRLDVELAHLPVVARREVRLVRVRVADGREHRHPAALVQLGERLERGMPVEAPVLLEGWPVAGLEREGGAEPAVAAVADRREDRQRVRAARQEDVDEDTVAATPHGCLRDALVERRGEERRGAVDGQCRADGARQERAAVEARTGGPRHTRLDRGQTLAGLRDAAAEEGGSTELVAVVAAACAHAVCISGLAAMS